MGERRCLYCEKLFPSSKFQPRQTVCGEVECQRARRTDYHRKKIVSDPEYRLGCLDSPRKWRSRNPGYWKQYRQKNPAAAEQNRRQQNLRDQKRKLCNLANNTSALDLKYSPAKVWLIGTGATHLANNNSALAQVFVIKALLPRPIPPPSSCKQHPAGSPADSAA